ncbi:hypothetical protein ACFXNW_26950 [Nocardia sp. NPDC059180]|uniref:hypothetical protein n=1 Tax=Nocardia sp. NPDC059180 TaxID=3346761 RepID=UPI00369A6FAB
MRGAGPSPVVIGRPTRLLERTIAEFRQERIPASYGGAPNFSRPLPSLDGIDPALTQPLTSALTPPADAENRTGTEAVIVIVDQSLVDYLFGEHTGSGAGIRLFGRARRVRSAEHQICDLATKAAITIAARRLLVVCDAERTSAAERTRAIRWVRSVAHRVGYECAINGLHGLATSYTVIVSGTTVGHAARSVVDWYRAP